MDEIRSFVAIDLPQSVRSQMESLQEEFKRKEADVRWVRPEGIHLTLKFLGDITPDEVGRIGRVLASIVPRWAPFSLQIKGLGCFPSVRNPRIIWVGIHDGANSVSSLQRAIEKAALDEQFPSEDRPFKPHLTLGRVRSLRGRDSLMASLEIHKDDEVGVFVAREVGLFRSELKPSGAVYTCLQRFQMTENDTGA